MIGPPLTMLFITEEFQTIQHEIDGGILMPTDLIENQFPIREKWNH